MRSLMFVPGHRERMIQRALGLGAFGPSDLDVAILDLEDGVAPASKDDARRIVANVLSTPSLPLRVVRIQRALGDAAEADLDAIVRPGLAGVVAPKVRRAEEVEGLAYELEKREADLSNLLQALRSAIQDDVKEIRLSSRLKASAACLVLEEGDLSPALEAMLRQAGQTIPVRKPILELNPGPPVIERLSARFDKDPADPRIADSARLLFGQAVLAEGGQLEDPSGFAELVNKLMAETL